MPRWARKLTLSETKLIDFLVHKCRNSQASVVQFFAHPESASHNFIWIAATLRTQSGDTDGPKQWTRIHLIQVYIRVADELAPFYRVGPLPRAEFFGSTRRGIDPDNSRWRMSGEARALATAVFNLTMIGFGVPAGAKSAYPSVQFLAVLVGLDGHKAHWSGLIVLVNPIMRNGPASPIRDQPMPEAPADG
jgi:hypothetical protein